jgi:hypothetical protein
MRRECSALEAGLASSNDPCGAWYPKMFRACESLYRAEFDDALLLAREYAELGSRFGDANVAHAFSAQVAEVLWLRGGAAGALSGIESLASQHSNMPEWRAVTIFFQALADPTADVEGPLEPLSYRGFSGIRRTMSWTLAMCCIVEVVVRRNLARFAPALYELLEPYSERNVVAGFGVLGWGSMFRFLGDLASVMNRVEEGLSLVQNAIRLDSAAGATSWVVRSECSLARLLQRHPDLERRREAVEVARRVHSTARSRGMIQIVRDIEAMGLLSEDGRRRGAE